jgi:glycosyltransferase involved in cell wall biosynthesis
MHPDRPAIEIAVATYNAGPWLDPFLESLAAQDFAEWRVLVRDDGSTDGTPDRLSQWQRRLPERFSILPGSGAKNLGATANFNAVLQATAAARVMMADQDDIWLPQKIARTLDAMRQAEKDSGAATPLAIFTDAEVIDGAGVSVAPSYWQWNRTDLGRLGALHRIAMDSPALGCTMMLNRALLDVALPIPAGVPYHDWWLAMAAVAFGRLVPLRDRTIRYRRHGANVTSDPYSGDPSTALRRTLRSPAGPRRRLQKLIVQTAAQSRAFVERYRNRLPPRDAAALDSLANLPNCGPLARRVALVRHGLWFSSPVKNLGLLALL